MKYESRFYLDNPKLNETFVIMAVTTTNGRLKYSTGLKIAPKEWPENIKDLKPGSLKSMITSLQGDINAYKILFRVTRQQPIPKEQIKSDLDAKYGRITKATKQKVSTGSFVADTDKILGLMRKGEILNPKTGTAYAINSIVSMENTRDSLITFQKEK